MKKIMFIIIGCALFSFTQISGQKNTAAEYWRMEQDPVYKKLVERLAAGALTGTIAGHLLTRDTKLSIQQGLNIALATAGGEAVGLGFVSLFTPESMFPYYTVSYLTGLTAYSIMIGIYRKNNSLTFAGNLKKPKWNINIMPQNLLLNKKIGSYAFSHPGKRIDFLPAFSATLNF